MTVKPKSVILAKDEGNKDFRIDQVCLWLGGAQEMLGLGVFGTDQVCLWLGGWGGYWRCEDWKCLVVSVLPSSARF